MCTSGNDLSNNILLAVISGLAASVFAVLIGHWVQSKTERKSAARLAIADWAAAFEHCIRHHANYYRLEVMCNENPELKSEPLFRNKFLDANNHAMEAGIQLDVQHYRVLLMEHRSWAREEVTALTRLSRRDELLGTDVAKGYLAQEAEMRRTLGTFLRRYTEKK